MGASADGVKSSSAVLYSVIINNSGNSNLPSYVKLYNLASAAVVVGSTAPDEIIYVPAGAIVTHFLFTAAVPGKTFATALSAACLTAGGTAGVSAPAVSVSVTLNYV